MFQQRKKVKQNTRARRMKGYKKKKWFRYEANLWLLIKIFRRKEPGLLGKEKEVRRYSVQFSSLSHVQVFVTPWTPHSFLPRSSIFVKQRLKLWTTQRCPRNNLIKDEIISCQENFIMDCENNMKTSGKTIYLVPLLSVPYTWVGTLFPNPQLAVC